MSSIILNTRLWLQFKTYISCCSGSICYSCSYSTCIQGISCYL